jgi:hypothetical protein
VERLAWVPGRPEALCCSSHGGDVLIWSLLAEPPAAGDAPATIARGAGVALVVKVILTLPCIFSLVIIYTKYTGWHQNYFNVHA